MCDPRIYTNYRCADPITGLCVCDPTGPYSSKKECQDSWQCQLDHYEDSKPKMQSSTGERVLGGTSKNLGGGRATEPSFYVQQ